jgi:hypothetical protein
MGPGHRAAIAALVRLTSDDYDSPRKGDFGTVEIDFRTLYDDPWSKVDRLVMVAWASKMREGERGPYGSGPIAKSDLEFIGVIETNVEEAIVEQARAYAAEDPDELDAHAEYLRRLEDVSGDEVINDRVLFVAGEMRQVGWKIRRPA